MTTVSQKVISDIVKGLHPVTGVSINNEGYSLQSRVMKALLRSNTSAQGQLSRLVDNLYYFNPANLSLDASASFSEPLEIFLQQAICDDYSVGINAHELAADYEVPLAKVLAYLIDGSLLNNEQAVFFTHSLQRKKLINSKNHLATVVSFSAFKLEVNKTHVGRRA